MYYVLFFNLMPIKVVPLYPANCFKTNVQTTYIRWSLIIAQQAGKGK